MNILITGGSTGLGEAMTRKFAQNISDRVYFTYNKSVEKANRIAADNNNTVGIKCDFSQQKDISRLVERMDEINPDVIINNAYCGDVTKTHFHKIPINDFVMDFHLNVLPVIEITQAVIACFRKKKHGKIITILTSSLLNKPPVGTAVYVANKAYLAAMTKVWASENGRYNITSNAVSPAFMRTALTSDTDERIIEQMINEHPLKKLLSLEEVADTVFFLANASSHINGVNIVMNAGGNII